MPSISLSGFLRKARRFWFSGEDGFELDASPAAAGTSVKADLHAQNGSASSGLACKGMIRCESMDNERLARASSLEKQVKRQPSERKPCFLMPSLMGRRNNKVQAFPAAKDISGPPRSKAPIGGVRMKVVATRLRRETEEVSLWKRRTQAEPPRLQIEE